MTLTLRDSLLAYLPDEFTYTINLLRDDTTGRLFLQIEWDDDREVSELLVPLAVAGSIDSFADLAQHGFATDGVGSEAAT